ncbi:hypothetical protein QHF89_35890 [Polyangium sorediatum]|uniref:DUF2637 domain-containing protein n=2 Tax=Polyangium sorediatum TaxID=889274 RepID=A0ABT6P2W4_9BACT|nr:hypothetical protein [Polyangium sorediatum]
MAKRRQNIIRVDRNLVAVPRERLGRRKFRRRGMAREVGKGVLYLAGAGAVVALLANLDDLKNSKEARNHWWLVPMAVLVIGYMLRRRGNPYATAVLAVGGALFALGYAAQSKAAQAQPAQQQVPPLPPLPKQQFAPKKETGAPFAMGNPPPMGQLPDGGLWVQAPDGQYVRLSRSQAGAVADLVNRVTQSPARRAA